MNCPEMPSNSVVHGNSLDLMKCLPSESVDLVITSPPYASKRGNHYNTVDANEYKDWFLPFGKEIRRVLKPTGSFVLNIKDHVEDGNRHPYVFDTVKALQNNRLHWNDTYIWKKTNPYPVKPVKRMKDGFEYVFHFTKSKDFKFFPDDVMVDGNDKFCSRYRREAGVKDVSKLNKYRHFSNTLAKGCRPDGSYKVYPSNVIDAPVATSGKWKHPARFPPEIPAFFIKLLTERGDKVLDPFAGSGTTNAVAVEHCRETIGFDLEKKYVDTANDRVASSRCVL